MEKFEVLQKSRLFENLMREELDMLVNLCVERDYAANDIVVAEGDQGDALFIIASGEVDVLRKGPGGEQKIIATLTAPDFFGEMSIIDKEPRSATIRASRPTQMLMLTASNLHTFARTHRNGFTLVVISIARVLSHRLRETNAKLARAL